MTGIQASGTEGTWNPSFEGLCFRPEGFLMNPIPLLDGPSPMAPLRARGRFNLFASCIPGSDSREASPHNARTAKAMHAWRRGPGARGRVGSRVCVCVCVCVCGKDRTRLTHCGDDWEGSRRFVSEDPSGTEKRQKPGRPWWASERDGGKVVEWVEHRLWR